MRKKIIQVPMEDSLLIALDSLGKRSGRPRAGLIREAVSRYLAELKAEELDAIYQEGYRKIPDDTAMAEAQVKMLGGILPEESW